MAQNDVSTLDYEEIEAAIRQASNTQIPPLLIACIEAGIEKEVWRPNWIGVFASRIEAQVRAAAAGSDGEPT